jgi:hypothetical protein
MLSPVPDEEIEAYGNVNKLKRTTASKGYGMTWVGRKVYRGIVKVQLSRGHTCPCFTCREISTHKGE